MRVNGQFPISRRRVERGAAAVEFAIVVPIVLWIFFAIVNYGMVLFAQLALDNGARQAARFAVIDGPTRTCGAIEAEALNAVWMDSPPPTFTLSGGTGPCERPCAGSAPDTNITVRLDYTSNLVVPVFPFPDTITMHGEGVFRCEYS